MSDERPAPLPLPTASQNGKIRSPLPRWTMPVVAVLVLAAAVVVLVVLWRWIDGLALADVEKKAATQLDALKLAASIVVGGGGLFALYLAARRQRTQELELEARHAELCNREAELAQRDRVQAHAEQVAEANRLHAEQVATDAREDAAARRVTELYAKSVEQLGSDKAPVRLGGLYALERLAQDNQHQRQTVVNVLCAYLRMPFDPPVADAEQAVRGEQRERVQELQVRMTAQRILATHLHPGHDPDRPADLFWSDTDLDLTDATLLRFDLNGCRLREARFYRATFTGAVDFNKVTFTGTAEFSEATFDGPAWLGETTFGGPAWFEGATFGEVAWFEGTTFGEEVWFSQATFSATAGFNRATFSATAGFSEAAFAKDAGFHRAVFCGITEFGEVTLDGTAVLSNALVVHPVPLGSSWPIGWRPAADPDSVKGRKGTWHRLTPVDPDTF